jgi:hypothetical protein
MAVLHPPHRIVVPPSSALRRHTPHLSTPVTSAGSPQYLFHRTKLLVNEDPCSENVCEHVCLISASEKLFQCWPEIPQGQPKATKRWPLLAKTGLMEAGH